MMRPAQSGFTLVEMLAALAVFAMIASVGVGLLRASVDTQSAVDGRLADVRGLARLQAMLASDLGQAAARPGQDRAQVQFAGDAARMAFTRGGWSNLDSNPRSDLQRVEWRFDGQRLVRSGGEPASSAAIANALQSAAIRYRRADGSWAESFASTPAEWLPSAVELRVARIGEQPVTLVVALHSSGPAIQLGSAA